MNLQRSLDSLVLRGKLVKIFAWGFVALTVLFVGNAAYELLKPDEIVVTAFEAPSSYPIWPIVMLIATGLFLISIVGIAACSMLWIHRAHTNLREQDIDISYSPNWAVGSYFVHSSISSFHSERCANYTIASIARSPNTHIRQWMM